MTDYLKKSFTVAMGSEKYRDNWDRAFRKEPSPVQASLPGFDANGSPVEVETPKPAFTSMLEALDAYVSELEAHERTQYLLREAEGRLVVVERELEEMKQRLAAFIAKVETNG